MAVAGTSALAISVVAWMRGQSRKIPTVAFLAFFLFFTYNVFRELSGFNAAADGTADRSDREKAQVTLFGNPVTILMAGAVGFLVVLALFAHVPHPAGMFALFKESLVVASLAALGEAVVAQNHGYAMTRPTAINFGALFFGHMLLQFGGFYDQVFPPPAIIRM
jgi:hypothetical protein